MVWSDGAFVSRRRRPMDCPRCNRICTPSALRCDCGYDFALKDGPELEPLPWYMNMGVLAPIVLLTPGLALPIGLLLAFHRDSRYREKAWTMFLVFMVQVIVAGAVYVMTR
jgi:hypothetical protein